MAEQEKEKTDAEQTAEKTVTAEASAGSAEQTAGTELIIKPQQES